MSERKFPIQNVGTVRWSAAERAYRNYARFYGSDQSLERTGQRGGFGLGEFADLYYGGDGRCINDGDARIASVCQDPEVDLQISNELRERFVKR